MAGSLKLQIGIETGGAGKTIADLLAIQAAIKKTADEAPGFTKLAQTMGSTFAEAKKLANSLGLTAAQTEQAVAALKQLNAVGADTGTKFAALSQSLGVTADQFAKLDNAAKGGGSGLLGFATKLQQEMDKAALSTLALKQAADQVGQAAQGINNISGAALEAAKGLDSAQVKVSTLSDDVPGLTANMAALGATLKGQVTTTDLVAASYDVLSAGFSKTADVSAVMEASVKGAIGGFSDTATVSDALTSTLNAYGLSADNAGKVTDQFIQTQNAGKIVVDQYAQQIGKVAPLAAAAGISLEELNGFIATATVKGVQAEPAFSGLRQAIAAVLKPSGEAAKLAGELGVQFDAQALKTKGLAGILAELNAKGADTPEVLTQLFGSIEAVAAIAPSTGAGLKNLQKNIDDIKNSAGAADTAFNKVSASFEGQTRAAFTELNTALVSIGNGVKGVAAPIAGALAFLLTNFNKLPEPVKASAGVLIALTGGALTVGAALLAIAAVLPAVAAGLPIMAAGFTAVSAAGVAFMVSLTPALPLIAAIAAAIAAVSFAKFTEETRLANQELDALAANSTASGNEFAKIGGKVKGLNTAFKDSGKFSEEQKKTAQGYIQISKDKIKSLDDELAAAKAIVPATDEQRNAQTALIAGIEIQKKALEKQTGELEKNLTAEKSNAGGKKNSKQASEDRVKALEKEAEALKKTREAEKQKAEEKFKDSETKSDRGNDDTKNKKQQGFDDAKLKREEEFQSAKESREQAYQSAKEQRQSAFSQQQQAAEAGFKANQDRAGDAFKAQQQAKEQAFATGQKAAEAEFVKQQQSAEAEFNKQQQAEEKAFQEGLAAQKAAQNKSFSEADRTLAAQGDPQAQQKLDKQRQTEANVAGLDLANKTFTPEELIATAEAVSGIKAASGEAEKQQVKETIDLLKAEQQRQQDEADKTATDGFKGGQDQAATDFKAQQQEAETAFKAAQQAEEQKFKEGLQAAETAFNEGQKASETAFKAQQQSAEQAFKQSEKASEQAFKQSEQSNEQAFKQGEQAKERTFKAEMLALERTWQDQKEARDRAFKAEQRKLDEESANKIKQILDSAKKPPEAAKPTPIPAKKMGGSVSAGQVFRAGEVGAEAVRYGDGSYGLLPQDGLYQAPRDGFVLTAQQTAALFGGITPMAGLALPSHTSHATPPHLDLDKRFRKLEEAIRELAYIPRSLTMVTPTPQTDAIKYSRELQMQLLRARGR